VPRDRPLEAASLIGRHEASALAASVLWPSTSDTRVRSVVLVGDAGVGKSRLADDIAERARSIGHTVATVRVTPALAGVHLGPLSPLVPVDHHQHDVRAELLIRLADALLADPRKLFVIDDAQLLDSSSAGVLHLAMTRGSFRGVLTLRSGEPTDPAFVAMWKDGLAERIDLEPFDLAETTRFAHELLGAPLDGLSASHLWTVSRGNALFARELLVGAIEQGRLVLEGGVHRFASPPRASDRLAELLGARLAGLGVDELEALEVLAVAGELGLVQLVAIAGDEVVRQLEDRRLVVLSPDGRRMPVQLVHPLYSELLRERMSGTRKLEVHRILADQLESYGLRRRNDVLDLARWRLACGGRIRADIAIQASAQALARFDGPLAGDLARLARTYGIGERADLLEAQAFAQEGNQREAAAVFERTLRTASTDAVVVWAATELSVIQFWSIRDEEAASRTVSEARERLRDPVRIRQLDAHRCTFVAMANRPAEALDLAAPHLDAGGPEYLVAAVAVGPTLTVAGRGVDALELADRCLPIRLEAGDQAAIPDAFKYTISKVFALSEVGALDTAADLASDSYDLAAAAHAVSGVAWAGMLRGRVAMLHGDLPTAATQFHEASRRFAELQEPGLRSWCLAGTVLVAAMAQHRRTTAERYADLEAIDPGPVRLMQADVDRAGAWARRLAGDLRGAVDHLVAAIADADQRGGYGMSLSMIHDLARFGERDAAGHLAAAHRSVQGDLATVRVDMVEAFATDSGDGLDACGVRFARLGAVLFAAEAAAAASVAHRRAGNARRSVSSAIRSVELMAACPNAATPLLDSSAAVTELTPRELEIARLAAQGLSNRLIAAKLVRSVRTVENHLQRVYEKLGIDGRENLSEALERVWSEGPSG
jgi:DNA-binding CsgD family transcriptional regulator